MVVNWCNRYVIQGVRSFFIFSNRTTQVSVNVNNILLIIVIIVVLFITTKNAKLIIVLIFKNDTLNLDIFALDIGYENVTMIYQLFVN